MSYEILLNKSKRLVRVVHHKGFAQEIGARALPEVMQVLVFKRWSNILVDVRSSDEPAMREFESFFQDRNIHRSLPGHIRMGVLAPEDAGSKILSSVRLDSSNIDVRLFTDEEEALSWFS